MSAEPTQPDSEFIARGVAKIREQLAAVARPDVRLIGVSKTFPAAAVSAAIDAGLADFGESYAQEFVAKAHAVAEHGHDPQWHFVGGVQRNKVRKVASVVDLWHSVDRPELALEIAKRAAGARVLLQVDVFGEDSKGGCPPGEVESLLDTAIAAGLEVEGLMAMAPYGDPETSRPGFAALAKMAEQLHLRELSMGMSGDFVVAASEGATMVRIGSAIFGARPAQF